MSITDYDGLPPLREVIADCGLMAKKSLGQNFLLDLNLTDRIARAAGPLEGCEVLEIGPGPGGLTRALLKNGAARVVVVERDPRTRPALDAIAARWPGRLEIIDGDATKIDPRTIVRPGARIAANLPYNVGTPLLISWLKSEPWPPWWASATLMFQREVADRIAAAPGDDAYGRLSVLTRFRARAHRLFDVSPSAFTPPPKVISSVVRVEPLAAPVADARMATIERVTAAAFGQRRKTLRQSLKALGVDTDALCAAVGVDSRARAETLDVAAFAALARAIDG